MTRTEPLPFENFPPRMRDALAALTPPEPHYDLVARDRPRGANVLGAMAHHPALAKAFFTLQGHLLRATTLTERHRELVIMRVAALRHSPYEWAQHLLVAADAGLAEREISWIVWGPEAPCWSAIDAAVLRAVDDLERDGSIGDGTWAALTTDLDLRQILDLVFTAGSYGMLAWMIASLGVELDDDLIDTLAPPEPA